jgi:hypothetical protein
VQPDEEPERHHAGYMGGMSFFEDGKEWTVVGWDFDHAINLIGAWLSEGGPVTRAAEQARFNKWWESYWQPGASRTVSGRME